MNIKDVERKFAVELEGALRNALGKADYVLPEHYQLQVSLGDAHGRKKRSSAAASNWSPASGSMEIRFEPITRERNRPHRGALPVINGEHAEIRQAAVHGPGNFLHPAEADLLKALDRAESRPGWNFVPLKKFRDEILPQEHFTSMPNTDVAHREVLRTAIEKKFILLGKVPNPRAPQFPVTTIRLNRLMPEVKTALGLSGDADLDFHPVEIRGEPLSSTILRDRR